jgi:hypothetical protein
VIYLPPGSFKYSTLSLFDDLENVLLDFSGKYHDCTFCLLGDFNAKSGRLSDFQEVDNYIANLNFDHATYNVAGTNQLNELGFTTSHFTCDNHRPDNFGRRLLELCKLVGLYLANGRCGADAYIGKTTTIYDSVIYFVLLSGSLFPRITLFDVKEYDPLFSDVYCVLELCYLRFRQSRMMITRVMIVINLIVLSTISAVKILLVNLMTI